MLTILSRIGIILYFIVQIPDVVDKKKNVTTKSIRLNLETDNDPYPINLDTFDVGMRILNPTGPPFPGIMANRSKYFKFEISEVELR